MPTAMSISDPAFWHQPLAERMAQFAEVFPDRKIVVSLIR